MYYTTWETANIQILIYWAAPGLSCGTQDIQSWLWHAGSLLIACGIWFPDQGSNLGPLHWEHRVLVTGLPGKSMELVFYNYTWTIILNHPVVHLCTLCSVEIVLEFSTSCSPSLWPHSKESACNAGDPGSIPGSGRYPGEGNGYPFQYSGLENPTDRRAWLATVHGVAKSQTWLSNWHFHFTFTFYSDYTAVFF